MEMIETLETYRKGKSIPVSRLDTVGITRSKYYRLLKEPSGLSFEDFVNLGMMFNVTPNELQRIIYVIPTVDTFKGEQNPYEKYDIIVVLQIAAYATILEKDEALEIYENITKNKYVSETFPLMVDLIKIYQLQTTDYEVNQKKIAKSMSSLFDKLMKREEWSAFEVTLLYSLSFVQDAEESIPFKKMLRELNKLYKVQNDDLLTIRTVTTLRLSLFEIEIANRDSAEIITAYNALQHARHNENVIYVAFMQRMAQTIYLYLQGDMPASTDNVRKLEESMDFILDYKMPRTFGPAILNGIHDIFAQIDAWRSDLGVDETYDLLAQEK
ncbi:hypothetical protein [Pseudolactococcus insecticola]|uniref:Transcriptional regulator n=1 Tax=Pseudolactococcus insecticola TaxID=2709158 RepID=A0A6A0B776_9LACT|nr:hypothetical protein [Lactococcus insecticola]GFH40164.1 hypothetical protein Hs20B_05620 [Lactococcus insecticola]